MLLAERVGFEPNRGSRSEPRDALETTRTANDRAEGEGDGGEGGIRTRQDPLDSVSYGFHNADVAVDARDAVAHCPLLPAGCERVEHLRERDRLRPA